MPLLRAVRPLAVAATAAAAALSPLTTGRPQSPAAPSIEITISAHARNEPMTGRVYVALSRDNKRTPIQQAGPTGSPLFSTAVEGLKPGAVVAIGAADVGHPVESLANIPAGEYWVQPFVNVYTRFARADGKTRLAAHGSVGGTELEAIARQPLRRSGADHVRPEVDHADQADGRQGDPADRAAGRHRARQAHPDQERDPDRVVGPADLLRRDRAAAEGLRRAPGRALPGELRARPLLAAGAGRVRHAAATSTRSGWRPTRRA